MDALKTRNGKAVPVGDFTVHSSLEGSIIVVKRVPTKTPEVPKKIDEAFEEAKGVNIRLVAHRALKWLYGNKEPEGSYQDVLDLYKDKYAVFCIADACAETAHGKMLVYQSDDFRARFDLADRTPLLKIDARGFVGFWKSVMYRVLRGDSSPIELSARHRDGSYRTYSLHAFRCIRNRFLVLTLEENLQLPEHLEHEKKSILRRNNNGLEKLDLGFRMLKWYLFLSPFNGTTNGATLETVVSQQSADMFVVADMHKPKATEIIVHRSPTFMDRLVDLEFLMKNLHRPVGYTDASFRLWDILVCPLYNGRPVVINRKFTCKDAVERWYAIRVSFAGKKRFVVGTFEEVDPPQENRTAEMNFGCYDFREAVHTVVRAIEWQPSLNKVNEAHLKDVKTWMFDKLGPESDTRAFVILDKCFSNVYESYVYRSPNSQKRFGDIETTFKRIESSFSLNLQRIMKLYTEASQTLYGMVKGMAGLSTTNLLPCVQKNNFHFRTDDRTEVLTINATTWWCPLFEGRYVVVCWDIVETVPYLGN